MFIGCSSNFTLRKQSAVFLPGGQLAKQVVLPHTFSAVIVAVYTVFGSSGIV